MSTVLTIKDAYEVASIAGVVDDPEVGYYHKCGIISKDNLEAIIGDNKIKEVETNLYYAIVDYDDNELEYDDDFNYIVDCFADDNFDQDEDYDGEYWVMAKCEYTITFTDSVTDADIKQIKAYIVRAANIDEDDIEESRE